jgi:hypothetical protein
MMKNKAIFTTSYLINLLGTGAVLVSILWFISKLIGDGLYPLASAYVQTGQKFMTFVVGPSNPQLTAALSAGAVGLGDKAREHFETALRQAQDVPLRILQPSVLYWYGRSLATDTDGAERERGRAMVEAALTDFRTLGMVLHTGLAEQFLRHGPSASPARTRAF